MEKPDEALLSSYPAVESNKESSGQKETKEQISDNYMAGNNEETFLRNGKDLTKQ